ncbi:MAG: type II toxin-antitoxin system VapC family toxin [Terriglobales bacterium]
MGLVFLDTSALVKLYIEEAGSASLEAVVRASGMQVAISALGAVEFRAAIRARERQRALSSEQAAVALASFSAWAARGLLQQALTEAVLAAAGQFLDRHPLRAPDALQLASCVALHHHQPAAPLCFVCCDQALLRAAAAEEIPHWDPAAGGEGPGRLNY